MADLYFTSLGEQPLTPTIDDLIARRNNILSAAERNGTGDETWQRLGLANRHITRVIEGLLPLVPGVREEIERCLAACEGER